MKVFSWVTLRRGISLYRNCWLKRMHFHISHVYVCRAWMSLSRRWRWSQTNDAASVISIRNEMRCVFSPRRQGWGVWRRTYQSNHPTEKWNQIPIQIYIPPNQDPKRRISLCVLLNPSACTMALWILRNVKSARANRMTFPDISTSEWWVVCDWHFHSKSGNQHRTEDERHV